MPRGLPDYSMTIGQIARGETYPQFEPRTNFEKYKIFLGVFPTAAPLAVGATFHYLDIETFLPCPYTHVAGFFSQFIEWFFILDGRVEFTLDLDGIIQFYMVPDPFDNIHEYEQIVWGKSSLIDPTALLPHTWDFYIKNIDSAPITGSVHTALTLWVKE